MELKDIVTNIELSLKLEEFGIDKPSLFYWVDTRKSWKSYNCPPSDTPGSSDFKFEPFWNLCEGDLELELVYGYEEAIAARTSYNDSEPLPAYCADELLELLPDSIETDIQHRPLKLSDEEMEFSFVLRVMKNDDEVIEEKKFKCYLENIDDERSHVGFNRRFDQFLAFIEADSLSNVLALMLIHLLENKLIEINKEK